MAILQDCFRKIFTPLNTLYINAELKQKNASFFTTFFRLTILLNWSLYAHCLLRAKCCFKTFYEIRRK